MLTCDEIARKARALSASITKDNYKRVAEQILPFVPKVMPQRAITKSEQAQLAQLPEVVEERRADQRMTTDDDWIDMVVVLVTTSQANVARNAFLASLL